MAAAVDRWAEALRGWAVPDEVLAQAPASPYGFSVELFARIADDAVATTTPSVRRAGEALPDGGSVLDVGCGAGAASLPLAARAGRLIGVDESAAMLEAFEQRARDAGTAVETHAGRWPDVAQQVPAADVVVCRNVAYNVADLDRFAAALSAHVRQRVVMELTADHPLAWTAPYWQALWGHRLPDGPTVDDAVAVLTELGLDVTVEHWETPWLLADRPPEDMVAFLLRRLCLPADRATEVRGLLDRHPPPARRDAATVWWLPT